jgi:WD40 repeat protein
MKFLLAVSTILLTFTFGTFSQELYLGLPLGHNSSVNSVIFSQDGKSILTASMDGTARLWDISSGKLIHTLKGHDSSVNSAVFSPDGKSILTASTDKTARTWNIDSGKLLHTLEGHSDYVSSAVFSSNGKRILTASFDQTARIWDASSGILLFTLEGHTNRITSAIFSPDGKSILTASTDETARIWDTSSGKLLHTLEGHSDYVSSAVFSPDGKSILTASFDQTARLWNTSSGKLLHILKGHDSSVNSVAFSPDSKSILTASYDNTARLWDTPSGKLMQTFEGHTSDVNSAVFSPDGKNILTASDDATARLWNATSGKQLHTLQGYTDRVNSAVFSPDGKNILTASFDNPQLWDTYTGKLLLTLEGHTDRATAILSPDGKIILSASWYETVRLWDISSGKLLHTIEGHTSKVNSVIFGPDGKRILTASVDKTARIWDTSSGKLLYTLGGHNDWVYSAVFSPDGKSISTASFDETVRLWESSSGKLLHTLKGHTSRVYSVVFSPDGKSILTTSKDKTARIWDTSSGKLLHTLEGHNNYISSAIFSPDGKSILTASKDETARLWGASSGELLHTLEGHTGWVKSAVFSPEGKRILTASEDKSARIWDASSGKLLHILVGHTSKVNSAVFSPDGKVILTASWDKSARLWTASSGKLLHSLEGHAGWVSSAVFSPDKKRVLTASWDGSIIIWDVITGKQLIRHFIFDKDPKKWVHLHSSGLFDASPEAMKMMYWTKGLEVIEFAQLKDRYWVPGLWEKVIKEEPLPDVQDMQELKLQPVVEINEIIDGKLPIKLTKRDGGYGKVSIWINGKEVINDARGDALDTSKAEQTIYYSIKNHPYLKDTNIIEVKASSADGFVQGRGVDFEFFLEQEEQEKPTFYGIIVGVDDYINDAIDLKYPGKDAESISKAVELGAQNLFGTDQQYVYSITSSGDTRPNKENIKNIFDEVAGKAKAQDVLLVYLSGHGITLGGDMNGDFHFLTADATAANKDAYRDPMIRENNTISTAELVEWIKAIPALKQVMIIDACGSGKAVDNLIAARDVESSQVKAIDRMKDRTGMYIISGCAADAVSYEASQYGQGLLTYSILQAMKGAALKENKYVDVFTILDHAREMVPTLAEGLGGIQVPQLLIPKGGSFDIGILEEEEDKAAIILAEPKQVYIRSMLLDKTKFRDVLEISKRLNEELSTLASKGSQSDIIFFDAEEYASSCQITGGYKQTDNGITLDMTILCGQEEQLHTVKANDVNELISKVLEIVN